MWPNPEVLHAPWFIALAAWFWGSFLNQVVDRTPKSGTGPSNVPTPTLLHPRRSVCLTCGTPLPWYENIPILTYLVQRGRCRHCGVSIGTRTLVMEIATPLLLLAWYLLVWKVIAPPTGNHSALFWSGAGCISWLLVAGMIHRERRRFTAPFLALGVLVGVGLLWAGVWVSGTPIS